MRRLHLLLLAAFAVPVALVPLGCEDSSSPPNNNFDLEAGPGFDANTGNSPDTSVAPGVDAGGDSTVIPPAPKGVSVTVTRAGLPASGVRVLFHDATGAVSGDVMTGATGKVTVAKAPSMVTVLASTSSGGASIFYGALTYLGVAEGDNLVVVAPVLPTEGAAVGFFSVGLTSNAVVTGATGFDLSAGGSCFNSTTTTDNPVLISLYPECVSAQNAILATAYTPSQTLGFAFQKNVAKPAAGQTTNVGPLTFAAQTTTMITASNLPDTETHSTFATLGAIANGALFNLTSQSGPVDDGGTTFQIPAGFADAYQSFVQSQSRGGGVVLEKSIGRREAPPAAGAALPNFDFATALPFLKTADFTATTFASGITLTSDAALTAADGGFVSVSWSIPASDSSGNWTFVVPPNTTTLKPPTLPADADAAAFLPTASARVDQAVFVDATQLTSYAQLKALPISAENNIDLASSFVPLPSNGTVKVSRLVNTIAD